MMTGARTAVAVRQPGSLLPSCEGCDDDAMHFMIWYQEMDRVWILTSPFFSCVSKGEKKTGRKHVFRVQATSRAQVQSWNLLYYTVHGVVEY
jgi:hypothetical protein